MKINVLLGAGLLAGSSMALAAPAPPAPVAPPVLVRTAPPPAVSICSATAVVQIPDSDWQLCLVRRGGWIHARTYNPKTGVRSTDMQLEHGMIMAMLVSTRLEPLWPQLIEFVGEDGEKLRAALRRRAQSVLDGAPTAPRDGVPLDNFVEGSVLATLQAAEFLSQAGDLGVARSVIGKKRTEIELLGFESDHLQFSWMSLLIRLAKLETNHGNPERALALYTEIEQHPKLSVKFKANGYVNHASLLAKMGQPREALAMLAQGEAAAGGKGGQVAGSDRQFAWIRACALTQLGDKKGAQKAIKVIRSAPASMRNATGQIASTESIEMQMAYCMGDDESVARMARNPENFLIDPAALLMQRGFSTSRATDYATNRRVEQRFVSSGYVPLVRQMPEKLVPAMNFWRSGTSLIAPPVQAPAAVGAKG